MGKDYSEQLVESVKDGLKDKISVSHKNDGERTKLTISQSGDGIYVSIVRHCFDWQELEEYLDSQFYRNLLDYSIPEWKD